MYNSYFGTIVPWACNFAPNGWEFCLGQQLQISDYQVLFTVIGNRYGGDGVRNFNLPNLQGKFPMNQGTGIGLPSVLIGSKGGSNTAQLTTVPYHNHNFPATVSASLAVSTTGSTLTGPTGTAAAGVLQRPTSSTPSPIPMYTNTVTGTATDIGVLAIAPPTVAANTGSAGTGTPTPFNTMPPYLTLNYIICVQGDVYPVNPN